jgi:hypothetical protein
MIKRYNVRVLAKDGSEVLAHQIDAPSEDIARDQAYRIFHALYPSFDFADYRFEVVLDRGYAE